jgi:multidrug transporter EmrE-like cation transporter
MNPKDFFKYPGTAGQKQYEALRAFYVDNVPGKEVIRRFGYTYAAFNSLKQRFKNSDIQFFITPPPGRPKGSRVSSDIVQKVIAYRKKNLSGYQIAEVLETHGTPVHLRTIFRILEQEGFPKLPRRTHLQIGLTKDNTIVPESASALEIERLDGWKGECSIGGIFLFAPLFFIIDFPEFKQTGLSADAWVPLLELAIFGSSFAFIFFTFSIQRIGVGKANAFTNLIPVITAIIAYFILDEILNINKIIGILFVIGGLFLSQIKTNRLRERLKVYIRPSE